MLVPFDMYGTDRSPIRAVGVVLVLTSPTGTPVGYAVVSPDAKYAAFVKIAQGTIRRRFGSPGRWLRIRAAIQGDLPCGSLPASSDLKLLLIKGENLGVECAERVTFDAATPEELNDVFEAHLRKLVEEARLVR